MTTAIRATGSQTELAYIIQTEQNTTPTTGTMKTVNCAAETFDAQRPTEFDQDITSDGMKRSTIEQLNTVSGGFTGEFETGAHEDFLISALGRSSLTQVSLTDTVSMTGTGVAGADATLTFSGAVSISGLIAGGPVKLGGYTEDSFNGIFRIKTASSTTGQVVVSPLDPDHKFDNSTEAGASKTTYQRYAKNGGSDIVAILVEKRMTHIAKENGVLRTIGNRVNSVGFTCQPGGSLGLSVDAVGLKDAVASDGLIGPHDYVANGITAIGQTSVAIKSGTTDPAAGDILYFEGDRTRYNVASFGGGAVVISPALVKATADEQKAFFYRPATNSGKGQKHANNLGYVIVDGSAQCLNSINLTITPNFQPINCIGNENAIDMTFGERSVTGSLVTHFSDNVQALLAKIRAKTAFSAVFFSADPLGNVACLQLPSIEADKEFAKRTDMNAVEQNIPFKAIKDTATDTTFIFHSIEV